ncbi:MAG: M23 family peptidase, partial [Veillonella sp.]|nr:M23 family peptidase [Veillonella sp.]
MIKSKEGILKVPSILSYVVSQYCDNCIITLSHKQAKIVAVVAVILFVAALVLSIWGIARQAEIVQLRQQTQLQTEQLKLLQQKTEVLDKKIQNLNQISEENKQMLKGAESGTPSQGGSDGSDPKQEAASDEISPTLSAAQLSARLSKLDKDAQKLLVSFYTMRNILRDGGAQDIAALQQLNYTTGSGGYTNSTTPSIWPSKGVITSPYGTRVDPGTGAASAFHEGVDIADD